MIQFLSHWFSTLWNNTDASLLELLGSWSCQQTGYDCLPTPEAAPLSFCPGLNSPTQTCSHTVRVSCGSSYVHCSTLFLFLNSISFIYLTVNILGVLEKGNYLSRDPNILAFLFDSRLKVKLDTQTHSKYFRGKKKGNNSPSLQIAKVISKISGLHSSLYRYSTALQTGFKMSQPSVQKFAPLPKTITLNDNCLLLAAQIAYFLRSDMRSKWEVLLQKIRRQNVIS